MKRKLVGALGLAIAVIVVAGGYTYWRWFERPLPVTANTTIHVQEGQSLSAVSASLVQRRVLYSRHDLVWLAKLKGQAQALRAGDYTIHPGASVAELLHTLVAGPMLLHKLTIIDGWTFKQMFAAVEANPMLKHALKGASPHEVMVRLGHPDQKAEGRFYPNTYKFARGTTDVAFLRRAYHLMQQHLQHEWQQRDKKRSLKTPYDSLIMASIIEKESADPAELERIAGVFYRRLQKGMRLQTDPTVIYGMGAAYDGNLTRKDLRTDTPYNTYTRGGLPPTPIALPSLAAIHAAMHPKAGEALYFVAKGDGTHQFSATLAEHNRAVRRYQLH